jgi:hypothetical protein
MVSKNSTPAILDSITDDLVLKIRGTHRDGQLLHLRSGKCTIGSGRNCTLRLKARNVAPVHCLIVRGQHGTIVRRWAPDTRLNGRAFSDSELSPGDCLGIGPVEFEVVALHDGNESSERKIQKRVPIPTSPLIPADSAPLESLAVQNHEREALLESLKAEKAEFDRRIEEINEEVVALREEKELVEQEKADYFEELTSLRAIHSVLQAERQAFTEEQKKLQANQDAITKQQKDLRDERNAFQADRDALTGKETTLKADQESFCIGQKSLESEREAFRIEKEAFLFEKNSFEADRHNRKSEIEDVHRRKEADTEASLAEQFKKLDIQRKEVESLHRAFEEQNRKWQANCQLSERQLHERSQALDARDAKINEQEADLASSTAESETLRRECDRLMKELDERKSALETESEKLKQAAADIEKRSANLAVKAEELDRRAADLDSGLAKLDSQKADLASRADAFESAQAEVQAHGDAARTLRNDLETQTAELQRRVAEFSSNCEEWERQQRVREDEAIRREQKADACVRDVAAREEELHKEQEQLKSQQTDLEWQIRELENLRKEHAKTLEEFERERELLSQEREDLERDREAFLENREELNRQREDAKSRHGSSESEEATDSQTEENEDREEPLSQDSASNEPKKPVDLQEILRKMGHKVEYSDEDSDEISNPNESISDREQRALSDDEASHSAAAHSADENEESIDDYMAQLMQRWGVNQNAPNASSAAKSAKSKATESADRKSQPQTEPGEEPGQTTPSAGAIEPRRAPSEITPRAVAAEKNIDLSTLRDIANLSAKNALGKHETGKARRDLWTKAFLSLLSMAIGVGLLLYWHAHQSEKLLLAGAGVTWVTGVFFGLQYMFVAFRLVRKQAKNSANEINHEERTPFHEPGDTVQMDVPLHVPTDSEPDDSALPERQADDLRADAETPQ